MTPPSPPNAKILIATDIVTDAELIKKQLQNEFDHVFTSTNPDLAVTDFEQRRPDVMVLAFNTLEKSERYYLGLYRQCPAVHEYPHRTVILCNKDEVARVYDLCRKDLFDDYILFWPMTFDTSRLPMSIHSALREIADLKAGAPSAAEFAAQARRLAELQATLDQQMLQGGQHIEVASRAVANAQKGIGAALDGFSRQLTQPDGSTVRSADELKNEINRLKREEIGQHLRGVAESVQPLRQWSQELVQECAPQLESVRALNASMAELIRPTVLVVDDDEFQRKMVGKLLEAENYQMIYAGNGIEALTLLRKARPDLILMDVMMPEMDGLETTRRLKATPQHSGVPVIMITGQSEGKIVVDSLKAGASDFVVKPFNKNTLIDKVARALSKAA